MRLLRKLSVFGLLLLPFLTSSSQPEDTRVTSAPPVLIRQVDLPELTTTTTTTTTVPKREGTQVAQHRQEVAYYPPGSMEALICSVFVEDCDRAVRVARCESGLNPYARNRSGALGLFQLLGHADLFEAHGWDVTVDWSDPWKNTVVAHDLWSSSGWSPWVCR